MNYIKLAKVIREKAEEINRNYDFDDPDTRDFRDTAELLNCLARMLEGKSVHKAFGAPGDWGYGTPIGDALSDAYHSTI